MHSPFCSLFFHFISLGFLVLFLYLDALIIGVGGYLFSYYFTPDERDARVFAKEALKNDEWLKVVIVEDKDTPQAYLLLLGVIFATVIKLTRYDLVNIIYE